MPRLRCTVSATITPAGAVLRERMRVLMLEITEHGKRCPGDREHILEVVFNHVRSSDSQSLSGIVLPPVDPPEPR